MRTTIGIDPGRNMGWCVIRPDGVRHGTIDLGPHGSPQLKAMYTALDGILATEYLGGELLLCYEEPAMLRGHALLQIQRMLGVVMLFCEFEEVPHYPVNQATLKAWVKEQCDCIGKMDKEAMLAAARAHDASVEDHNAADAFWLARYALQGF